jgi:integrase
VRGSKRKGRRPGLWELRIDAGFDPLTGTRRQRSISFEGTSREADRKLAELTVESSNGRLQAGSYTVAKVVEAGLEQAAAEGLERTTIRGYRRLAEDGGAYEKDTKNHQHRVVSLSPQGLEVLRRHRAAMAERALACGVGLAEDAFVFSGAADGSIHWWPSNLDTSFRRMCRKAGIPDSVKLHGLRHTQGESAPRCRCPRPDGERASRAPELVDHHEHLQPLDP